jgi:protein disulfide-isomerase
MRALPASAVLAALLAAALSGCGRADNEEAASAEDARQGIQFIDGFEPGVAAADESGKPMLVFFGAKWCRYCQQMSGEAFEQPSVVELSAEFVCVRVDADAEPDVCHDFGVDGYPTIQFISPGGVLLNRIKGKKSAPQLAQEMQAALQAVARRQGTTRRVR